MKILDDGAISLHCYAPEAWCAAYSPSSNPEGTIGWTCDGTARVIDITCQPAPSFWFDVDGDPYNGCEADYGEAAARLLFGEARSLEVSTASGTPTGLTFVPVDPAPTIIMTPQPTSTTSVYRNDNLRFDLSGAAHLSTADPIPVNVSGVDCFLAVDADVTLSVTLGIFTDPITGAYRFEWADPTVIGWTAEDFTLTGGFVCSAFSWTAAAMGQNVFAAVADSWLQPLCEVPPPELLMFCS